jgi:hypothetical protein
VKHYGVETPWLHCGKNSVSDLQRKKINLDINSYKLNCTNSNGQQYRCGVDCKWKNLYVLIVILSDAVDFK